jgi:hypothetical protein
VTALINEKMRDFERWTYHLFPLAAGFKAWKHAAVGIEIASGKVKPATAGATLLIIGIAAETVDAVAAEKQLNVNLCMEIEVEWWASAGGITAANVGSFAYFADDQTVGLTANGMFAGRIWAYDAVRGVAVQKLGAAPGVTPPAGDALGGGGAREGTPEAPHEGIRPPQRRG